MKYFVSATECIRFEREIYIEFQPPAATKEFGDPTSLYMHETVMFETGFGEFWSNCMRNDIVFDMNSISKDELFCLADEAAKYSHVVSEIISELKEWADTLLVEGNQSISVNWEFDRVLARRREQRETFPIEPHFQQEALEMQKALPLAKQQTAYEALLRKNNMPNCFFPLPLFEPDKWL